MIRLNRTQASQAFGYDIEGKFVAFADDTRKIVVMVTYGGSYGGTLFLAVPDPSGVTRSMLAQHVRRVIDWVFSNTRALWVDAYIMKTDIAIIRVANESLARVRDDNEERVKCLWTIAMWIKAIGKQEAYKRLTASGLTRKRDRLVAAYEARFP